MKTQKKARTARHGNAGLLTGSSGQVVGRRFGPVPNNVTDDVSVEVAAPDDLTATLRYRTLTADAARRRGGDRFDETVVPMTRIECAQLEAERFEPFRVTPMYKGKRAKQGLVFWDTNRQQVWAESRLEAFCLRELDRDPTIVNISSQPFEVAFHTSTTRSKFAPFRHVPDFFGRCADGNGLVIDVKPRDLVDLDVVAQFEWTAAACAKVGWGYRVMHEPSERRYANMLWLAGFRRQSEYVAEVAPVVFDRVAEAPVPWGKLIRQVAYELGLPLPLVIPAVGFMVWHHDLSMDLDARLTDSSLVTVVGGCPR